MLQQLFLLLKNQPDSLQELPVKSNHYLCLKFAHLPKYVAQSCSNKLHRMVTFASGSHCIKSAAHEALGA